MELPWALAASTTPPALVAEAALRRAYDWADPARAKGLVALGGDGFMLHLLHDMLDRRASVPVFGMNLGTVGFLMNEWRVPDLPQRIAGARAYQINPLTAAITTSAGVTHMLPAINELSLLRETRQAARLSISDGAQRMIDELVCDGVLVATPAGSTAYNLSANGPILPLGSNMLALTPISPFRPRRWRGAILPDTSRITITVAEAHKRPVSAVADQREIRDVASVSVAIDRDRPLTLLFDPGHGLEERIALEQFIA